MFTSTTSWYLFIYRYARKLTKGYLFLICNSLLFFFSLPLIEILIAIINGSNDNTTKYFPFIALYPKSYYNYPLYEVKILFSTLKLRILIFLYLYLLFFYVDYLLLPNDSDKLMWSYYLRNWYFNCNSIVSYVRSF